MYSEKYLAACKRDFRNFAAHIWLSLDLPPLTPVQNDMAHYLQHGPRRMQLSAFRGVGKSYLTAAYVCWELWKDRELKIMIVSAGSSRADAFAIFVRNMIRNTDILKHMEPDKNKGERATQNVFDINGCKSSGSPSVKSVGIGGQMTGSRANIIIADDCEVVANSATNDLREKLLRLCTEFDAILSPNGRTMYLGTPQSEMTVYTELYKKGYEMRIYPARVPTREEADLYGAKLAPMIREMMLERDAGQSTDPLRFTDVDLAERELSYGRSGFQLQFMLNPSLADGDKYPLKIDDLVIAAVNDKLPEEVYWSNNPLLKMKDVHNVAMAGQNYYAAEKLSDSRRAPQMSVLAIDPSGRGKDETGYCVAQMLNGNIFIPKAGGILGGYTDAALIELCHIAKAHKVNQIVVESNFGDGMFTQLMKPHMANIYNCQIEEVRQHQQKETRIIDTLEPVMNQHRLIVDPKVILEDYESAMEHFSPDKAVQYMLFYQMSRLSKDRGSLRHDDRLDAVAMAVQHFLDVLDVDQEFQKKRHSDHLLDESLNNFKRQWMDEHGSKKQQVKLWGRR